MSQPKKNASFTELSLGRTGQIVAANVLTLREQRKYSYKELSETLFRLGNEIPPIGLRRIEARARRVTVDDLVALSVALETSPLWLLTPHDDETPPFATGLEEDVSLAESTAWIRGETDLSLSSRLEYWNAQSAKFSLQIEAFHERLARMEAALEKDPDNALQKRAAEWTRTQLKRAQENLHEAETRAKLLQIEFAEMLNRPLT